MNAKVEKLAPRKIKYLGWTLEAVDQDGEVLYRASDVATKLGYSRATEIVNLVERSGGARHVNRVALGMRGGAPIPYLTEAGVFYAVMRTRGQKAEQAQAAIAKALLKDHN